VQWVERERPRLRKERIISISEIFVAVGSVAAAASLYYFARQAHESNEQQRLANLLALLEAQDRLTDISLSFDRLLIESPRLRLFFRGDRALSGLSQGERDEVLAVAEYFTDFLENAIVRCELLKSEPSLQKVSPIDTNAWRAYVRACLATPAVVEFLGSEVQWYAPALRTLFGEVYEQR
jgi:hypothetical protein